MLRAHITHLYSILEQLIISIYEKLFKFGYSQTIYLLAPLAIFLSLLTSIGPSLQTHVFGAINNLGHDLYSKNYGDSVTQFPTLPEWLLSHNYWVFFIIGITISIISLTARNLQKTALLLFISSSSILTISDAILSLLYNMLSLEGMILNVVANISGGVLIAFLTVSVLSASKNISSMLFGVGAVSNGCFALLMIIFGLLASTSAFYTTRYIYHPIPVNVALTVNFPVSSAMKPKPKKIENKESDEKNKNNKIHSEYSFIPERLFKTNLEITSLRGTLKASWSKKIDEQIYDVNMWLTSNCGSITTREHNSKASPDISAKNIHNVSVEFDDGMNWIHLPEFSSNKFLVSTPSSNFLNFRTDKTDKNEKNWSLSIFSDLVDRVSGYVGPPSFIFSASAVMLKKGKSEDSIIGTPRKMIVSIDEKKYTFSILPSKTIKETRIKCKNYINYQKIEQENNIQLGSSDLSFGIAISIIRKDGDSQNILSENGHHIEIMDFGGWVKVDGLDNDIHNSNESRFLDFVSVSGTDTTLSIDGNELAIPPGRQIQLHGNLKATVLNGSSLNVDGKAHAVWGENRRLNKTAWENLSSEWQLFLVGVAISISALFVRYSVLLFKMYKNQNPKVWFD